MSRLSTSLNSVAYHKNLVKKGFFRSWWRVIVHFLTFGLQLFMQLTLIIILIKSFSSPWSSLKLSGLIRVCLIFSSIIGLADSAIGLSAVLFMYRFLLDRNWPQVNQILAHTHRQHRSAARLMIVLIIVAVGIYVAVNLFTHGRFFPLTTFSWRDFRVWSTGLAMLFILSKNLLALSTIGAKENLIQADQNEIIILILNLLAEIGVFILTIFLLRFHLPILVIFAPFLLYSPLKWMLINLFCRRNYPWLNINLLILQNPKLTDYARAVVVRGIGCWILSNIDFIIILVLFGLERLALINFFNIFIITFRVLFLRIIRSSVSFLSLYYSWRGRLNWKQYLTLNHLSYSLIGLCFVCQLVFVPYLANIFFNDLVVQHLKNQDLKVFFHFIFLEPWFALLESTITALILLLEVHNILIVVNRYHQKVIRSTYLMVIFDLICVFTIVIPIFLITDSYQSTLISALVIQICFLLLAYCWGFFLEWWRMTSGTIWPRRFWQPILLFVLPVTIINLLFLFVIVPNPSLSFAGFEHNYHSAVLKWDWVKFIFFTFGVALVYGLTAGLSSLLVFSSELISYFRSQWIQTKNNKNRIQKLTVAVNLIHKRG